MEYTQYGKTGMKVSRFGLGCMGRCPQGLKIPEHLKKAHAEFMA